MKKMIFLALICLVTVSCSKERVDNMVSIVLSEEVVAPVMVHVDGFSVEQGEFSGTRTSVDSYTRVKALTLAFYKGDGTEVYKHTQFRSVASTYTTFGEFACSLGLGSYTMVVLGYGSESEISLTSPTMAAYTEDIVRETFAATQEVNITNYDTKNLSATLDRIISLVLVNSTDGRTADVNSIRVTFSGGSKSFNPTTGLATSNTGFSNTVTTSTAVGSSTSTGCYLFLNTDEQTMNVTIETLDADNHVLFSKTVNNVPLRRNRYTTMSGAMYSGSSSTSAGSFELNDGWLTGNSVGF